MPFSCYKPMTLYLRHQALNPNKCVGIHVWKIQWKTLWKGKETFILLNFSKLYLSIHVPTGSKPPTCPCPSSLGGITCGGMENKGCQLPCPHYICCVPLERWQWIGVWIGLLIPFWSQLLWQEESYLLYPPYVLGNCLLFPHFGYLTATPCFLVRVAGKRYGTYNSLFCHPSVLQ